MTKAESKMSDEERRIRIAMLEQKMSRSEFAQKLGVKVSTLGNIIRSGQCSLTLKKKIVALLKVSIWKDVPLEIHIGSDVGWIFPTVKAAAEYVKAWDRNVGTGEVFRPSPNSRKVIHLKHHILIKEAPDSSPSPSADQSEKTKP